LLNASLGPYPNSIERSAVSASRGFACVYGSPECGQFKGRVGARQHWSCLPGRIFSAVATGLPKSMPGLREDDRVLLASVAAWGVFGAVPALAAEIASDAMQYGRPDEPTELALRATLQAAIGTDIPIEVEAAGRALLQQATGKGQVSPESRLLLSLTQIQLKPTATIPKELAHDPTAKAYVVQHLGNKAQEAFWVIPVDSAGLARSLVEVGIGHYHSVGVPTPAVLTAVLHAGTDLFWVAHNHPSGNVSPSADDAALTKQLAISARSVRLHLVDHVIVGPGGGSASLADLGKYEADWGELSDAGHEPV